MTRGSSQKTPRGLSASPKWRSSNGGNGTITFYGRWQHGCDTGVTDSSGLTNFYVGNCACSTPLSDAEWNWARFDVPLPNLIRCHTCKQAPATPVGGSGYPHTEAYNCLAWVIGDTSRWWDLEKETGYGNGDLKWSSSELNAFLTAKGVASGTVVYYGPSTNEVVHVAKKSGGNGSACLASSKLGDKIRMSHDLHELEGGNFYYNIVGGN